MAAMARHDQEKRTVEVNREKLVRILEENKTKHVQNYLKAKEGYKAVLLEKVEKAFSDARSTLEQKHLRVKRSIAEMTDDEIGKQRDHISIVDSISVEMKVPRCCDKEYDAAIDMAKWDVRETLELTHAEFTCFVRDQWDWTSEFAAVSALYMK